MPNRKMVIVCMSVFTVILVLVGVAGYFVYQHLAPISFLLSRPETPEHLKQARIVIGEGFLEKKLFIQAEELRAISSISYGELDPSPGLEFCIVGETGTLFVDEQGNRKNYVSFAEQVEYLWGIKSRATNVRFGLIQVVDVDGDHISEFLVRSNHNKAELLDHKGQTVWAYGKGERTASSLRDLSAGDINGDEKAEYVAAASGDKGLVLLDNSLNEIWSKPDIHANVVEFVKDVSGQIRILHDDFSRIVLRDADGNMISNNDTGHYIGHFSLSRWPSKNGRQYALHFNDNIIRLFDFNGKTVAEFKAPFSDELYRVHGAPVKLKLDQPEYFVAIAENSLFDRSVLYIYSPTGTLIYQEVLPEICESIAALPLDNKGREAILLGSEGKVLQYSVK